jgi:hypothetical protein
MAMMIKLPSQIDYGTSLLNRPRCCRADSGGTALLEREWGATRPSGLEWAGNGCWVFGRLIKMHTPTYWWYLSTIKILEVPKYLCTQLSTSKLSRSTKSPGTPDLTRRLTYERNFFCVVLCCCDHATKKSRSFVTLKASSKNVTRSPQKSKRNNTRSPKFVSR